MKRGMKARDRVMTSRKWDRGREEGMRERGAEELSDRVREE